MIYIVGGVINERVESWLKKLRVIEYCHISINTNNITPEVMNRTAERLLNEIRGAHGIISIGSVADKLLTRVHVVHGTLPASNITDLKTVANALDSCTMYLYQRSSYAITPIS